MAGKSRCPNWANPYASLLDMLRSDFEEMEFDEHTFKESIMSELENLFNAHPRKQDFDEAADFPEAQNSFIFWGILAPGAFSTREQYAHEIRRVVRAFEPRLYPESVSVSVLDPAEPKVGGAWWWFKISAEMWSEHGGVPVAFYVRFDLGNDGADVVD